MVRNARIGEQIEIADVKRVRGTGNSAWRLLLKPGASVAEIAEALEFNWSQTMGVFFGLFCDNRVYWFGLSNRRLERGCGRGRGWETAGLWPLNWSILACMRCCEASISSIRFNKRSITAACCLAASASDCSPVARQKNTRRASEFQPSKTPCGSFPPGAFSDCP
jgi:hypothetical protein